MFSHLNLRLFAALTLGIAGWSIGAVAFRLLDAPSYWPWSLGGVAAGAVLGLLAGPAALLPLGRSLQDIPTIRLFAAILGLIVGLIIAALLSVPLRALGGWPGVWLPLLLSITLGLAGSVFMVLRENDLAAIVPGMAALSSRGRTGAGKVVLDTSAIIDGRIADISQTGFIDGTLVVASFVLDELRHIADSSDSTRRNRGRRGLEILNRLSKETEIPIEVLEADHRWEGMEVDGKLVMLAKSLGAPIVTTDYNLNRVAEIQGVTVLNVNELANALKSVVIPGEELQVRVIQEGKELGQGVGFLDDGTMIVVENGRRYVGSSVDVVVTRVLQTAAGRLIFTQIKGR
ncbi:MAG: PIN domain-containing protein [Chloroflexi bacterium]|nr:PIN domain-containing protein [Chloroflexota bacterium]